VEGETVIASTPDSPNPNAPHWDPGEGLLPVPKEGADHAAATGHEVRAYYTGMHTNETRWLCSDCKVDSEHLETAQEATQ